MEKDNKEKLIKYEKSTLPNIDEIEKFANAVKNSALAKAFEKKQKDGSVKVDTSDIIAAVALGHDMGITPAASLLLGKKLNANSYFSVLRGKELGLDPITSISKIYVIPTQNGDIIALDVSIITKAILDSGTSINIIRDFAPTPMYYNLITNAYIGHKYLLYDTNNKLRNEYFIYINDVTTKEEVQNARNDGKIILIQNGVTNVTTINFNRPNKNTNITVSYSIQEAIDAGLYNGFHSSLIDVKSKKKLYISGRDNWNKHPHTMLRNRPLSIGGRIIAADKIQGGYSIDEAMDISNVNSEAELETVEIK